MKKSLLTLGAALLLSAGAFAHSTNSDISKNLNVLLENTIKLSLSATDTLELKSYVFPVSLVSVISSFPDILIKNISSKFWGAVVKSIKVLVEFKV